MTANAIAQVYGPRYAGRDAVGVVWQSGEEAPKATNDDADADRQDESTAGRVANCPE